MWQGLGTDAASLWAGPPAGTGRCSLPSGRPLWWQYKFGGVSPADVRHGGRTLLRDYCALAEEPLNTPPAGGCRGNGLTAGYPVTGQPPGIRQRPATGQPACRRNAAPRRGIRRTRDRPRAYARSRVSTQPHKPSRSPSLHACMRATIVTAIGWSSDRVQRG